MNFQLSSIFLILTSAFLSVSALGAEPVPIPDFTKGEKIPEKAKHDWNLGATGFPQYMTVQKAADVRKAIADIEAATDKPELRKIR